MYVYICLCVCKCNWYMYVCNVIMTLFTSLTTADAGLKRLASAFSLTFEEIFAAVAAPTSAGWL